MAQSQLHLHQAAQKQTKAPPRQPTVTAADVAERPALAPNVELQGEMQESGFNDKQWLVQRDGRYIQLTELLYRIAEQANGQRTLDQIAEEVSQAINRRVSADNVRHLLEKKLIPMGLIAKADGSVVATGGDAGRSPLAVNMRMKMVSPRVIEPITAVLQYLWKPPILIVILTIAAVAHGWLYGVKGVSRGFYDALYEPRLLLVLLLIIVVSAAFHEFGHASALRYGGGKVGGMGVGLYLIYPAFYTDVTDNYRLGRWARIRTDLGGFYFNLIFELGLLALYFWTGYEFLLVAVFLLDLEIIHQSLPFVRLDGYWALADLTGIPDFFSHIGPYLRTVLPLPWWKGRKLPNLKGWVKLVFGLYILITVPLLLFLLFMMIKGVPRVLATAWDSFQKQMAAFSAAQNAGDMLGMLAGVVQMLTLALPTFGLLFILYKLGRRLATAIWYWSKPTPTRRVIGALGSAGAIALLAFLWAPQMPFMQDKPGPLYVAARSQFVPIQPHEQGTAYDFLRSVSGGSSGYAAEAQDPDAPAVLDSSPTPTTGSQAATTPQLTATTNGTATARATMLTPTIRAVTPTATVVPVRATAPPPTSAPIVNPPTQSTPVPTRVATPVPTRDSPNAPTSAATTAPTDVPTSAPTAVSTIGPTSTPPPTP
jgi:putative peptide zinc metalloprotease protein